MGNVKTSHNGPRKKYTKAQFHRDRMQALGVITGVAIALVAVASYFFIIRPLLDPKTEETAGTPQTVTMQKGPAPSEAESVADTNDSSGQPAAVTEPAQTDPGLAGSPAETSVTSAKETEKTHKEAEGHKLEVKDGITYVDGIMIVNKTYSLPPTYAPGLDPEAEEAFNKMANDAWGQGLSLFICSGFRSYREQEMLYNGYAEQRGVEEADRVSSRAGHSEHQSGLCMDINTTDFSFANTKEAVWLANNCADYGFIIRFPLGKESITGYTYEPWHIRYVGLKAAKEIYEQDICLEEYLNVTSDYKNSKDQNGN